MQKLRFFIAILLTFFSIHIFAQIRLPKLISDGMILQRDTELKIWGWAAANEDIELFFKEKAYKTQADENGSWVILLPPQNAGGPFDMVFKAKNKIALSDILFGDVWLCSGQSNMELTMERVKEKYSEVIKSSENPNIRQFLVPDKYDFKVENNDLEDGNWVSANPETVLGFSAVAYFFAKELNEKYHVPIGLVNAALGGSPVEAWMSESTLKEFPEAYNELQKYKDDELIAEIEVADRNRSDSWYAQLNESDQGLHSDPDWSEVDVSDEDWESMKIPGYWGDQSIGNVNGVVWFRKEITVPKSMVGKPTSLWLGRLVDQDYAYINGQQVGTTGYQYPPRRYTVNPTILKAGKNIIAVRLINNIGQGGFVRDKPYFLAVGEDTIDLKGEWKYKLGTVMEPLQGPTFISWKPAGLYNKMIAPLTNFKIKGAIWYQGESNANNPSGYQEKFVAMISNWRQSWQQGDFPFIYVQLANYMEETLEPVESRWAELRQEQLETLSLENTGMAVAIDLGEWNDIHPLNKQDVAKRLALQTQKLAYNERDILADSPTPAKADFKREKVIIHFKNAGQGLIAKDDNKLHYFSISGDGENFVWANAKIERDKVVVWSAEIENPLVVRYAWADNPKTANLYADGLPASPFEVKRK